MTPHQLTAAEARYQRDLARADQSRTRRDDAIRAALASGMTQRDVAKLLGITHGRVGQIATSKEKP